MGKVNGKDKASNVALWQLARRTANHPLHTGLETVSEKENFRPN